MVPAWQMTKIVAARRQHIDFCFVVMGERGLCQCDDVYVMFNNVVFDKVCLISDGSGVN